MVSICSLIPLEIDFKTDNLPNTKLNISAKGYSLFIRFITTNKIGWRKTRNMAKKINLHPQTKTRI